jgi:3-oxoacyl-[acyl-carrier protein] reductase
MDYGIAGLPALVTGASGDIGAAVALTLVREGADVLAHGRDRAKLDRLAATPQPGRGRLMVAASDLGTSGAAEALVRDCEARLGGGLALLVVCHSTRTAMAKVFSLNEEELLTAARADWLAVFALLKLAVPSMMARRYGRIVLTTSASAELGQGKAPLYTTLKAGLEGLGRNLAIDFGKFGITANAVAPGFIDTERLRARVVEPESREALAAATSLKRLGRAEEVAEVIAFLCSRAASYVNGAVVPVTGGAHLMNLW